MNNISEYIKKFFYTIEGIFMKIGYVRVSTVEQHEERQIIELKEKANVERIYKDKLSGKNTERPQLRAMIDFAREGDTIYLS